MRKSRLYNTSRHTLLPPLGWGHYKTFPAFTPLFLASTFCLFFDCQTLPTVVQFSLFSPTSHPFRIPISRTTPTPCPPGLPPSCPLACEQTLRLGEWREFKRKQQAKGGASPGNGGKSLLARRYLSSLTYEARCMHKGNHTKGYKLCEQHIY